MRGRRFASNQDIERHIANGFGAGAGADYVPWLRVQDVPSIGRSWKIQGVKIDRIHHLLSDLERAYFLLSEFSEDVVDIREQYPLLPVESTQAIARAIGVRYPRYKATSVPLVMTTDFLLTVKQPNGDLKSVARTIKYQKDLQGEDCCRTLEKLEIERRFWMSQGVDWSIVTEELFTPDLILNLAFLRKYAKLPRALMDVSLHSEFIEILESIKFCPWSTSESLRKIGNQLSIPYSESRDIFFNLIWRKIITLDLSCSPLHLKSPLPDFNVVSPTDMIKLSEMSS
ncbi:MULTISPECIES: TnsA endonuclease N-terminal domain-containing protein [unclassified Pseudomonas]|uniref:TnsA endonuclease N-terminal domain-containing protein n=1 Tax=unclassified Pseudomonas TaxID=196821 RepID=UPI00244ADA7E|nr:MULTISPECIES: TnsA endonuclease N-terminal domain-containing protein [unclassified Pseudomonas]MDG9929066.1 TnsA endonuclease N-terminal domain-containing protein [Pseudomonas sp. GD04042]MDH0483779.1 TnsA endonuclease N-terminal domain-containing protein [Pseudomonas sp. GD04015]MDH0604922.1 TnsA endonuclease N-terminal domain-containing protein [Pseudomonas sp. GD03869]